MASYSPADIFGCISNIFRGRHGEDVPAIIDSAQSPYRRHQLLWSIGILLIMKNICFWTFYAFSAELNDKIHFLADWNYPPPTGLSWHCSLTDPFFYVMTSPLPTVLKQGGEIQDFSGGGWNVFFLNRVQEGGGTTRPPSIHPCL